MIRRASTVPRLPAVGGGSDRPRSATHLGHAAGSHPFQLLSAVKQAPGPLSRQRRTAFARGPPSAQGLPHGDPRRHRDPGPAIPRPRRPHRRAPWPPAKGTQGTTACTGTAAPRGGRASAPRWRSSARNTGPHRRDRPGARRGDLPAPRTPQGSLLPGIACRADHPLGGRRTCPGTRGDVPPAQVRHDAQPAAGGPASGRTADRGVRARAGEPPVRRRPDAGTTARHHTAGPSLPCSRHPARPSPHGGRARAPQPAPRHAASRASRSRRAPV